MNMVKDPVCNNEVDMQKERFSSRHEGREFWFDTRQCKALFDADPEKYIKVEARMGYESGHEKELPREGGKHEAGERVREAGERTMTKSKSHAKAIFSGRQRDLADTASAVSAALHEASKSLHDRHFDDTARFVDKSAEQIETFSARFRDGDADKAISGAEDYIRERPALAIGGALAAGFLLARFMKSGAPETREH
jgi:YHS domain-containing protein/ElaB/YqjD/DUF883 family membrane-anchored ribosome-binding protein